MFLITESLRNRKSLRKSLLRESIFQENFTAIYSFLCKDYKNVKAQI
jgi:hypothetical protein